MGSEMCIRDSVVTIYVCGINRYSLRITSVNIMFGEGFVAIILPPGNISGGYCCSNNIYIAIHIKIGCVNITDASKSSDDVLSEGLAAVVLKPGKLSTTGACS